jgi:hypothetical protein
LRERLTNRVRQYRYDGSETAWDMADAILAEIAAAGFELVPVGRMDRLVKRAGELVEVNVKNAYVPSQYRTATGYTDDALLICGLEPGDLDRPEGRE